MRPASMLANLGKPAASGDLVELLLECHARIRSFLDLAQRLAAASGLPAQEIAEAALRVHRYFTQALPLHARDEEESLLPRLSGRDPEVDRELETMRREHAEHEGPLSRLVEACAEIAAEPGRHAALAPALGEAASELTRHFEAHLAREEQVIFPAVRRLLDAAADAQMVAELRDRRR